MFDNKDIEIINQDDKEYYDGKLYQVGIWPGAGYQLATFYVYANSEETALNLVVADAELNAPNLLFSVSEIEDMIAEDWQDEYNEFISEADDRDDFTFATEYLNYIYVDATMEGASQPYFINGENLSIIEVENIKEEDKEIKKEARLTDYLGIMQIWDLLQQNPETANREFAILDDMVVEVGTGNNVKKYKATKNADSEWELTLLKEKFQNTTQKEKKTEGMEKSNIVWDKIEEYSQDEVEEIRNILDDLDVEVVKHNEHSVAVKIKSNGMVFWLDFYNEGSDIVGEWNQYIFSTIDSEDRIRQAIQTSYDKSTGSVIAFDMMESEAILYLEENGIIESTEDGYKFVDNKNENKALTEKYNQDGFPNSEELQNYFKEQGTLPDEIELDNVKYTMSEYGGSGDNSWVIYSAINDDDSYIRVYYSMNKNGKDSYSGVKDILGVSDLRETKEIKKEYYEKPDDEHIIWDSEFDISNYDMEELKEGPYQDYLANFDETLTPMSYEEWLDSDECAMYFNDMWTRAAQENDYYAEWYEFIEEYVPDEEKQEAYNEYVEDTNNTKLTPDTFEEWLDNNTNQLADDNWELQEEDLEQNILPVIDNQINDNVLILSGYYGSNYPDFRSSGNGGKLFDGIDDFRSYMGNFDRVCITTKNGVLGSILGDHDGTISGQFYTIPADEKARLNLIKAMGYEDRVKENYYEEDIENSNMEDLMETEFNSDLMYGGVDAQDFTNHMDLLVPIKDTISGYTPDPEPKKENKEKDDPNKYCAICGKEKEDYEASMCDDCWEKEQARLNKKDTKLKEVEAVEYISKRDYDKLPDDYKTTIAKTLQARQAVGDNVEKLKKLYKDLGYDETDPMVLANENGGTVLKPVKIQESKMSEIDIDVKNTLKQFEDFLKNEDYDEVDDDVVNEFFTEIFYNIDTEEELEAMNIAEKKIRHKYGLREAKELRHQGLKNNVKDYYAKNYTDDELGNNIKDNVTFLQLYRALKDNTDIYNLLGTADSTVRERVFKELAKILNTNYDYVYNIWQNGTTDGQPNIIKETKTLNEEEVVSTYTDNSSTVKIVKANNGRYFNYYYDGDDKEHWSSSAGPFDTTEEAEQMAKKHRPEIKKENKSNIETVYVPEKDMTIIFDETDNSTEIIGFYYGSPDENETKKFIGKLKATYDTVQESKTLVEDNTDPEEVANEIQTARENSENDTLSIEQVASSLDVLVVDEEGAIDGYKSYLDQAKKVISDELYQELDNQMQEIIKDEEDHIVKLNTIKDTLLGNTSTEPTTDKEDIDDTLNPETKIESKELCLEAEPETKTGTKREELNTGILPVVNVDMYSLSDNLYEYDIDQKELDDIVLEIAPKYIEDTLSEILPNVSVIAKSIYHPKQYNYSGDELEFDLVVDSNAYEELKEKTLNNPEFKQFLKDNYSSRSGFVSFMADDLDDFKTQEEWKQMVQVIMFNIPKDKIELNNDQYITEFMDNVYMNYAPIDDEDDPTENKSLKIENKDKWVADLEELESMVNYYAELEDITLSDEDISNIANNLAETNILDTFEDFKGNTQNAKDTIIAAIEKYQNKLDENEIPYDNTSEKKCPKCGKTYTEYPALSRRDNKTYICPQCGTDEAMEDFKKANLQEDNNTDEINEEFKVGDVVTDLIDNDLAVIEEIDNTRKAKYLLRFVEHPVMGEAFWYEPGRFEKETNEQNIKDALEIYNRHMKK